jgi:hypothetical protein
MNRSVKAKLELFVKFNPWHCRSVPAALLGQNSNTTAPADNFKAQFKIYERKLRSKKLLSFLQVYGS